MREPILVLRYCQTIPLSPKVVKSRFVDTKDLKGERSFNVAKVEPANTFLPPGPTYLYIHYNQRPRLRAIIPREGSEYNGNANPSPQSGEYRRSTFTDYGILARSTRVVSFFSSSYNRSRSFKLIAPSDSTATAQRLRYANMFQDRHGVISHGPRQLSSRPHHFRRPPRHFEQAGSSSPLHLPAQ